MSELKRVRLKGVSCDKYGVEGVFKGVQYSSPYFVS